MTLANVLKLMIQDIVRLHIIPQVGLAVDDIKGIQDAAVLKRLALQVHHSVIVMVCMYMYMYTYFQVELALSVEELLPIGLRRYFITEEFTVVPNRKLNFLEKIRYMVAGSESDRFDSQETISNALHPQPVSIYVCRQFELDDGG